ncbi:hypothetical protein OFP26_40645, partial [Escherichia coli]|nr:hypothetical protein [Escherichia coli]
FIVELSQTQQSALIQIALGSNSDRVDPGEDRAEKGSCGYATELVRLGLPLRCPVSAIQYNHHVSSLLVDTLVSSFFG